MAEDRNLRDKRRVTWAGVAVNLPLAGGKIGLGWIADSQALVADGVHSLTDLMSDAAVLWALGHSHRPPDAEHPFGHGRFETMATLAVAVMLALVAVGIVIDAGQRLVEPPETPPGVLALWAAFVSILLKEALFHMTRMVGRRTGSPMMIANAWHHRSDALSSVVALAGIGAALAGWVLADAAAAAIIALMLGRIAWSIGRPALSELVDTAPDPAAVTLIEAEIRAVPGVRDVHDLRIRRAGGALRGDGHVTFDGHLTLSEAHRLTEAARARARAMVPELEDILLHAEPEGHADGSAAHDAPLRPEIERLLQDELALAGGAIRLVSVRLDYRDDGLRLELALDGPGARDKGLSGRLGARLEARLAAPTHVVIAPARG